MPDDWKIGQQVTQELGQPASHNHPCLQCNTFANNWLLIIFSDDGMQTSTACQPPVLHIKAITENKKCQ